MNTLKSDSKSGFDPAISCIAKANSGCDAGHLFPGCDFCRVGTETTNRHKHGRESDIKEQLMTWVIENG